MPAESVDSAVLPQLPIRPCCHETDNGNREHPSIVPSYKSFPMRPGFVASLVATLSMLCGSAFAADDSSKILALLQSRFPESGIRSVVPSTTLKGWFDVLTENEVAYTDSRGELLIAGHVIDTATKRDLTASRLGELQKVDFSKLPQELAIKVVKGNGKRQLAVFADPLCPFCQQLEQSLAKLDDVTVYTYLYPLEELHPGATVQSAKIWCSEDRAATWLSWMNKHQNVAAAGTCDTRAINTLADLGRQLKINSTPTLIFSDGRRLMGNQSTEVLQQEMTAASGVEKTPANR